MGVKEGTRRLLMALGILFIGIDLIFTFIAIYLAIKVFVYIEFQNYSFSWSWYSSHGALFLPSLKWLLLGSLFGWIWFAIKWIADGYTQSEK